MGLEAYHKKRDFRRTPEPKGKRSKSKRRRFVVQEHHASKLHFDFRLEIGGVLKSWSVPRGPSLDPTDKRLAVPTEDHPIEYLKFEGTIPAGAYGAGRHMIWDAGTYELAAGDDALEQFDAGKLKFRLHGNKLQGEFNLVRMARSRGDQWLLIKSPDQYAEPGWKLELRLDSDEQGEAFRKKESRSENSRIVKTKVKKYNPKSRGDTKVTSASRAFKEKELSEDVNVKVGQDVVSLTNLDKTYWPDDGYTKGDLIKYYYEVSKYILPYLKDRPLILKRYPSGIKGHYFHQHDVDEAPNYVRTIALEVEDSQGGHTVNYMVGGKLTTLLYLANLGAIECHPWHSRTKNLGHPDWIVFDLDPGKGISFETICEAALCVREILHRSGLESYAKTSGSRGIHVYVPIKPDYGYERAVDFAEQVAISVAREMPKAATVERSLKKRRPGQIYIDHMQNARGKSVAAPYSVRPKPGATVSAPLDWSEVKRKKIRPQDFTIKNMLGRIKNKGDLFKEVLSNRQSLPEAFE